MIIKQRGENLELNTFRCLRVRKKLEKKDEDNYKSLEKGWLGEQQFDQVLLGLTNECLILNNLLLEVSSTLFQIDSLLITQKTNYIFEVKNFDGDYYFEDNRMHLLSGKEIKNPLIQLSRSESLFRQLLQELRSNVAVESKVVFINPEFYLYDAPLKGPFVFHAQLKRLLKSLNFAAGTTAVAEGRLRFAEKLVDLHIAKSPYSKIPAYTFEELEKGIVCKRGCIDFEDTNRHTLVCRKCGFVEDKESAVLRSIEEFRLLFPEQQITVNIIYDWCKVIRSKKTIQRILTNNFDLVLCGKGSYYVDRK